MTDSTDYPATGYPAEPPAASYPANKMATSRSRGALSGLGVLLLGAWGALIPFIGPYFDYAYTPNQTWTWTAARFWMQVLPGGVAFLAGLALLVSAHRVAASVAAWLAIAAGAWYVIGPLAAPLWNTRYIDIGTPVGGRTDASVEQIGMFYGLGAAIILLAAMAAGRFSIVAARDPAYAASRYQGVPAGQAPVAGETADDAAAGQPETAEPIRERPIRRHRLLPH